MIIMDFRNIIKPTCTLSSKDSSANHGSITIEPLGKGYGITIGNALRRMLLSSIEGSAIVGVKVRGASNEFTSIQGVQEDLVEIIMNLKSLSLNLHVHEQRRVYIEKKGEGSVTAADIKGDIQLEVLDPDQHIAMITDPAKELYMELFVERGLGYVPSEELDDRFDDVEIIPVDAVFTPIKKVNFTVGSARVGQSTDYDSLVMEVDSDGSITPEYAIAYAAKIIKDHMELFINFEEPVYEETDKEEEKETVEMFGLLDKSIEELELTVRAYNCLKNASIKTLGELCSKNDSDMLKTKNFGRKSLDEIKSVLSDLGLSLDMDLDAIGYKLKKNDGEI